jgi:hypothetical protein
LIGLVILVVLMAGPGGRRARAGETILVTIGGLLLLAILFAWVLFRSA